MSVRHFDILIIGGGIAGASVGAHLAGDAKIALIEREERPGYHSTGRSAALFSEIYGNELIRALSRASRGFFFDPPPGFAAVPLVTPRGALYVGTAAQQDAVLRFAADPSAAGQVELLSGDRARALVPILGEDCAAAAFEPAAADVDVHALHDGFLRQLRAAGGVVLLDHGVVSLERRGGLWVAATTQGEIAAPIVINAAGAWADDLAGRAGVRRIGLEPRRRTAVLVDPPDGVAIERWPIVIDIDEHYYFKPDAGLLLLSPADETPCAPCDAQPEELDIAMAIDRVEAATTLRVRRVRHKWAGLRSFVADRSPVVGFAPDAPGFFWLAGQGGYGIQTAPALGRLAAALARGRDVPEDLGVTRAQLAPERLWNRT